MKSPQTPHVILLDLLMATMDSMSVWALAAADHDLGLRWRDAVSRAMIEAGRYTPYERLVTDAAGALGLDVATSNRAAVGVAAHAPLAGRRDP